MNVKIYTHAGDKKRKRGHDIELGGHLRYYRTQMFALRQHQVSNALPELSKHDSVAASSQAFL